MERETSGGGTGPTPWKLSKELFQHHEVDDSLNVMTLCRQPLTACRSDWAIMKGQLLIPSSTDQEKH